MKVSIFGLLSNVKAILPKRTTVENQAKLHAYMLDELIKHARQVKSGELALQEFAEFYDFAPPKGEPCTTPK